MREIEVANQRYLPIFVNYNKTFADKSFVNSLKFAKFLLRKFPAVQYAKMDLVSIVIALVCGTSS